MSDVQQRIYDYYAELIRSGHLRPGAELPTVGADARTWECARSTVVEVRQQLCADGLVERRERSGRDDMGRARDRVTKEADRA